MEGSNIKNPLNPFTFYTGLGAITLLSGYYYYLMEWLFFITKPSMLSYLSLPEQVYILFTAPLPLVAFSLCCVCLACLISLILKPIKKLPNYIHIAISYSVPAAILTACTLLLIDNFSYTLFKLASHSTTTLITKSYYWIILSLFMLYFIDKLPAINHAIALRSGKAIALCAILICLSSLALLASYRAPLSLASGLPPTEVTEKLPNILFFNADGVRSDNMSVYGYERATTPFMDSIANESVIYFNHWTNSSKTTGSIGSLLSGKYPTRTKVIFRPDTFTGEDMFQHLPGILKQLGYFNIDITMRHYIDPDDLKLRNSFDYANDRYITTISDSFNHAYLRSWPATVQFIEENGQRLQQRLTHLLTDSSMVNPHKQVNQGHSLRPQSSDQGRMEQLKQQLMTAPRPFFANIHLLGPHGNRFIYEQPIFTADKHQPLPWQVDHYDNAIFQWDSYSRDIYRLLEASGELENTLLVFNSDHGWRHHINETLPLIIRYPNQTRTGVVTQASQRLDIAPTVLGYLGITPPTWMDGHDLNARSDNDYPIFIVTSARLQASNAGDWKIAAKLTPPFYSLGTMSMLYCGVLYSIDVNDILQPRLSYQEVENKKSSCTASSLTPRAAYKKIISHLQHMGYDTGSVFEHVADETRDKQYSVRVE